MMAIKRESKRIRINDRMFDSYAKKNTQGFADEVVHQMKINDLIPEVTGGTKQGTKAVRKNVSTEVETVAYTNWSLEYGGYSWEQIDGSVNRYYSMGRNENYGKTKWLHKGREIASKTYRPKGKMNEDWEYTPRR